MKRTCLHWLVNPETSSPQQPRADGAPTAGPIAKEMMADAAPQGRICSLLERCLCDKQFNLSPHHHKGLLPLCEASR